MTASPKKIILGVSGGIAAYKSACLVREFVKTGAEVKVVMTRNAARFVAPLTFETLSGNAVYCHMFDRGGFEIDHIDLAKKGDILVVAPATANIIGKFANGIADDLLSTLFLSFAGPVLIAPAMNSDMYANSAVCGNLSVLRQRGVYIVEPEEGELACGESGVGRMADADTILNAIYSFFGQLTCGNRKKLLVTAGPTIEYIDPVRYISNRSSGKMGYSIAEAGLLFGFDVTLISGPSSINIPYGVHFVRANTCRDMHAAVLKYFPDADLVVMSAAVCDFSPQSVSEKKIKKECVNHYTLKLKKNPDILSDICKKKKGQIVIGFAAETEKLIENATKKLKVKGLDYIVANEVGYADTGFDSDMNKVVVIDKNLNIEDYPLMSKKDIAKRLIAGIFNAGK